MSNAQTKFMVMSDMHVLDKSLYDDSTAFARFIDEDAKLNAESQTLFDKAILRVKEVNPELLLIPGDLSNTGQKVSHEYVSAKLNELVELGIKVYVVPGNHDVCNPDACAYIGDSVVKVPSVNEEEYKLMYQNCGYESAVETNGLSYMVYPTDKIAILCLDSRKPDTANEHYCEGGITEELLVWAETCATKAKEDGRMVIGMMHHPVMLHFDGHDELAPNYLANQTAGYPALSELQRRLAKAGVGTVFTGHYHLQSIQVERTADGDLWDIMTGSLCAYPMPMREGEILSDGTIAIKTISDLPTAEQLVLAKEQRRMVTIGAFYSMADKILNKMQPFLENPLTSRLLAGVPQTAPDLVALMEKHMMDSYNDMIVELAKGDEEQRDPAAKVEACQKSYDAFVNEMFSTVNASLKELALSSVSDYSDKMNNIIKSVFYNYKGSADNVVADNENKTFTPSDFSSLRNVIFDGVEMPATFYNLNGVSVTNPQHGVFIKDGQKVIVR